MTDTACRGVLTINGRYVAVTLERPWLDNKPDISCIPTGTYTCRRIHFQHFGEIFEVTGVTGRTHILFHPGNSAADSRGCILLGQQLAVEAEKIFNSRATCATFMSRLAPGRRV